MVSSIQESWKEKIDPEFDSAIKTFLRFVREIKKDTDEGFFAVNDNILNNILDGKGWQDSYDGNEIQKVIDDMIETPDGISKSLKLEIENALKKTSPKKTRKSFNELTKGLSHSSKRYYRATLERFADGSVIKPVDKLTGKRKEGTIKNNKRELMAFIVSLIARATLQDVEKLFDENEVEGIFRNKDMVNDVMASLFTIFSQIAYQKTIYDLLKKGDDRSILNAVTIDKSLVCTDLFKHRIVKAQLSGDSKFLSMLGRAISKKPLTKEAMYFETYVVLRVFWITGLFKLNDEELYYLLKSCGVNPPEYPYAMEQFLKRYIHPLYRN